MVNVACGPLYGPITAIEQIGDYIIAGCGPDLHVFGYYDCKEKGYYKILPGRCIHGIKHGDGLICVYGQKASRIVYLSGKNDQTERIENVTDPTEFQDWIQDVCWLKDSTGTNAAIAVALSHNSVSLWNWKNDAIITNVQCDITCILYCAHFIGNAWDNLVLAVGTVFNQIVLWGVAGKKNVRGKIDVLAKLTSHEGVIFSICYDETRQFLASVSDDRSIRLWKVSGNFHNETQYTVLHILYGHTARVWDVRLLSTCLVSIGEDATCCVWDYDGGIRLRFKGHEGKSIWSLAVSKDEKCILTGGGDSSLRLWNLQESAMEKLINSTILQFSIKEMDFPRTVCFWSCHDVLMLTNMGCLYSYNLLSKESILIFSDVKYQSYSLLSVSRGGAFIALANIFGGVHIFYKNSAGVISDCSKDVFQGKVFGMCWCSTDVIDNQDAYLLLTGPSGQLKLLSVKSQEVLEVTEITNYILPYTKQHWVAASLLLTDHGILICGDRGGTIHVYLHNEGVHAKMNPIQTFPRIHGKAGVTSLSFHGNKIYSTGRDGTYRTYLVADGNLNLVASNKVSKGFDWIHQILFTTDDSLILGFHTSCFVVWSLDNNERILQFECGGGHRNWDFAIAVETAMFVFIKSGMVVLCQQEIKKKHRLLLYPLHGRELTNVKFLHAYNIYGNGSPIIGSNLNSSLFVTTAEGTDVKLVSVTNSLKQNRTLSVISHLQGHISSVKAISISRSRYTRESESETILIFTGGGRAQIKCWKLMIKNSSSSHHTPRFLCQHLSSYMLCYKGLKRRKPWKVHSYDSSPETRFVALTSFSATDVKLCHTPHVHFIGGACSDGLIRLFVFNESNNQFHKISQSAFHEHCVLCICHFIVTINDQKFVLLLSTGTDGRVAIWDVTSIVSAVSMNPVSFESQTDPNICTRQFFNADNVSSIGTIDGKKMENSKTRGTNECNLVQESVTSRTDSDEDLNEEYSSLPELADCFVMEVKIHQSGVNSLDVKYEKGARLVLASGGDDNAVVLTHLNLSVGVDGNLEIEKTSQTINSTIHAAQITGIKIVGDYIITASIDQRLFVWQRSDQEEQLLIPVCSKFLDVSDVSAMDVWLDRDGIINVAVSGVGLQFLKIEIS